MNSVVSKAWDFAHAKHEGQLDDTGVPYIYHPYSVYRTLFGLGCDDPTLIVALLHDTLEDTDTTFEELEREFNEDIALMVNMVTHDGKKDQKGYYFPRLVLRNNYDELAHRATLVKFADRLSNLSRMEAWDDDRKAQYLRKSKFWKTEV